MKKLLLTTVLAVVTIVAMANPIDRTAAMQKAKDFMQGVNPQAQLQTPATPRKAMGDPAQQPYYIFNAENNKGFVIVSGDDRSEEILGYSDEGFLDVENMPEGIQYLLDVYTEELQALGNEGNAEASTSPSRAPRKAVSIGRRPIAPMTKSIWTQGTPFNNKYPKYTGGQNKGSTPPSGCGVIAFAQMMYYHQYAYMRYDIPARSQSNEFYTGPLDACPKRTFDFTKFKDSYEDGYTTEEADNISTFIWYVFNGVGGMFNKATSTQVPEYSIPSRLSTYFNYKMSFEGRDKIRPDEFEDFVYNDLRQGLPVIMCGYGPNWDHLFICDGYSKDGFFHFNFGWAGLCNGYFRISPLNFYNYATPNAVSKTLRGYFGCRPNDGRAYEPYERVDNLLAGVRRLTFSDGESDAIYSATPTVTRSADGTFNFEVYKSCVVLDNYTNLEGSERTFDTEFVVVDKDFNVYSTFGAQEVTITAKETGTFHYDLKNIVVPEGDGEYYFVHRSKAKAATDGLFHISEVKCSYCHYKAVVKNNKMTLSLVKTFEFDNSKTEIIGQCATNWHTAVRFYATNNTFDKKSRIYSLYVGSITNENFQDNKPLLLPARGSGYVEMNFNPGDANNKLILYDNDRGETDATYSYTLNTAVSRNLSTTWKVNNSAEENSNYFIYGNELSGYIEVKNNSSTTYNDMLTLATYLGTAAYNGSSKSTAHLFPVSIPAGGTVKIDVSKLDYSDLFDVYRDGMDYGLKLTLDLYSGKGDRADKITYRTYNITPAILWWDKNGKKTAVQANISTFTVPESAVAVSFVDSKEKVIEYKTNWLGRPTTEIKSITYNWSVPTITPNSNSNCIYYFAQSSHANKMSNRTGKNIVVNGEAANDIKFVDNDDAFVPISFHAGKVSYTRQFNYGYEGKNNERGWATICLPFNVEKITNKAQNVEIDFFRYEGDKGKNLWLRKYYSGEYRTLYFDYPNSFEANVPYLICMPGEYFKKYGDYWSLTGKDIEFSAENTEVQSSVAIVDGDNYDFMSTTMALKYNTEKPLYSMEVPGNHFIYQNGTVGDYNNFKTFRGYLTSEFVPTEDADKQVKVAQLAPMDSYEPYEIINHRFPAIKFTYDGLAFEVPAWDEVVVSDVAHIRIKALEEAKDGVTNIPASTVTNRAWSVDSSEPVFAAFEDGTKNITIAKTSKSVGSLTYGEACDLLNLTIANDDRNVKVFDFTSSTATELSVPAQLNVTTGVNAGHTFVVEEIGAGTYYNGSALKTINIPSTVTKIMDAAFCGCTMLNKVVFESVEPAVLEGDPFAGVTRNKCAVYVPSNVVKTYRDGNELWNDFIFAVPVSATNKFASFCSDVPFTSRQFNGTNWVAPSTIKMYWIDKNKNNDPSRLTMSMTNDKETFTIPAGFGLVMKTGSEGGSGYIFMPPVGASNKASLIEENNMLKGVLEDTYMGEIITNPQYRYYALQSNVFMRIDGNNLIKAGRAYLEMPKSLFDGEAKAVFTLDDEVTDGILLINSDEQNTGNIYDIQGRKVERTSKGIYIVNGKKVVMK